MATERQIEANQANAQRSTGPRTDEGKAASRGNARTHGLAGSSVASLGPDDAGEVARRTAEWTHVLRPVNAIESFYVAQYALESVRVERCQAEERVLRCRLAMRAVDEASWDEDRRRDAEETAARLPRDPARTVRRLRQTPQGCDWLIERWQALAQVLDAGQPWDDAQRSLALDLLGTPAPFRNGPTLIDPHKSTSTHHDVIATQSALAASRIAELTRLRDEVIQPRDEDDRTIAAQGIDPGGTALTHSLRLIRRYEAASQRRLERTLRLLLDGRLASTTAEPAAPAPAPTVQPQVTAPTARPSQPPPPPDPRVAPPAEPAATPHPSAALTPAPSTGNRRWRRAQQRQARRHAG